MLSVVSVLDFWTRGWRFQIYLILGILLIAEGVIHSVFPLLDGSWACLITRSTLSDKHNIYF